MKRALAVLLFAAATLSPGVASASAVKALNVVKGAQVWFDEDHTVPLIALAVSLPAGSAYDPSTKAGEAAFAAALLDEGAGKLDAGAFHAALAKQSIKLQVVPRRDDLIVSVAAPSSAAPEAFRLLGMALAHPRFDYATMARVRIGLLQHMEEDRGNPRWVAEKGFYSLYFGADAYGHPIDGDPRGLASVTREELLDFVRTHWVRGGMKVAIVGDIDEANAASLLRTALEALSDVPPAAPRAPVFFGAPGVHLLPMAAAQPVAFFAVPGPLRGDPDFLPDKLASTIFDGPGFSSRLQRLLCDKEGLTGAVSSGLVMDRRAGIVLGSFAASADDMDQALADLRTAMRRFASDGPTGQEVFDAKAFLTGSFPLAFTSDEDAAARLNELQRQGLPLDYLDKRNDMIDAVSADDVRAAARRLFNPSQMTVVVAGTLPKENAGDAAADSSAP
ncbi:MAG: insulinase family protein [Alphaproteobacteria bacterium]|nr:insulinase family protein [Alphaproteobacteria bacterium]MDE2111882.1 insulinase family protein [Alphaproteobacteria bacterium]MDE2495768.1 insulinase family protein [Alphaproteobacteria bacterium]